MHKAADVVAQFATLEQQWAEAIQWKDTAALEKFLHAEYTLTISAAPGSPVSRAQWLAAIPDYNLHAFHISGLGVRMISDAALVHMVFSMQADVAGADRSGDFFIVDLWKQTPGGSWKVAARYSSLAEKGELPAALRGA